MITLEMKFLQIYENKFALDKAKAKRKMESFVRQEQEILRRSSELAKDRYNNVGVRSHFMKSIEGNNIFR